MKLKLIIWYLVTFGVTLNYCMLPRDWYYGRELNFTSVASIATGGVELFEPSAVMPNPLSISRPKFIFSGAYQLGMLGERRTRFVFDQYDNTVGEIAIAENNSLYGQIGQFAFLLPTPLLNLEFTTAPAINYHYYFYREFRDDFYTLIATEEVRLSGILYKSSLILGRQWCNKFGFAFGPIYFFGSRDYHYYRSAVLNNPDIIIDTPGAPWGWGYTCKISYTPIEKLSATLYYTSSTTLKDFIRGQTAVYYPWSVRLNLCYLASGEIPTKLGAFASYTNWQRLNINNFNKVLNLGIGIEHTLLNMVALRYGFRIEPSFTKPTVICAVFTAGWGFEVSSMKLDVGAEIGRRELYPEHFLYITDTDRIYQNIVTILGGLKVPIELPW
ncbi:MAG: hypothetical protein ABIK10_02350 [candidate division WOR-3 bacterium]